MYNIVQYNSVHNMHTSELKCIMLLLNHQMCLKQALQSGKIKTVDKSHKTSGITVFDSSDLLNIFNQDMQKYKQKNRR